MTMRYIDKRFDKNCMPSNSDSFRTEIELKKFGGKLDIVQVSTKCNFVFEHLCLHNHF